MKHYTLADDEVVLFKSDGIKLSDNIDTSAQLILTNLNIIIVTQSNIADEDAIIDVNSYPVDSVKIYKGVPQIKNAKSHVEMYLKGEEIELEFPDNKSAASFVKSATELLTGKTLFQRGMEKVRDTIGVIDDTLGIDTVEAATEITKAGIGGGLKNIGVAALSTIGKIFGGKKDKTPQLSESTQADTALLEENN